MPWPTFKDSQSPLEQLVALSRYYGSDPQFVLAGGGNTSVKIGRRLLAKASGRSLATIDAEGFVELDRERLEKLLQTELSVDRQERETQFKQAVLEARTEPLKNQRPSVEAVLHHLVPRLFVVHTHATLVNMFTCCRNGRRLIEQLLGEEAIWIADVDPGYVLARTLSDALRAYFQRTGRDCPRAILMQNHGLVVAGDTPDEVRRHTDWLLGKLTLGLSEQQSTRNDRETAAIGSPAAAKAINTILPALQSLLSEGEMSKVVCFDDSPEVMRLVGSPDGRLLAQSGTLTPDQIVYCKSFPLWLDVDLHQSPEQIVTLLKQAVHGHLQRHAYLPVIVLAANLGLFASGENSASAEVARQVYVDAIQVMHGAQQLGGVHYLNDDLRQFIEQWEVEAYRRGIAAATAK